MSRPVVCVALLLAACSGGTPRILSTSRLVDTRDPTGPYGVEVVVAGLDDDDRVEVRWSVAGTGSFQAVRATPSSARDDVLEARIPGQPAGTTVLYFSDVVRANAALITDPVGASSTIGIVNAQGTLADARVSDARVSDAGTVPDAGQATQPPDAAPSDGKSYRFRVLARSGACRADSDCRLGLEICNLGTCRAYQGTCLRTDAGPDCPDGYGCDTGTNLCVILPRTCQNDSACPSVERCDGGRHVCVARPTCQTTGDCPDSLVCDARLGLCFAAP